MPQAPTQAVCKCRKAGHQIYWPDEALVQTAVTYPREALGVLDNLVATLVANGGTNCGHQNGRERQAGRERQVEVGETMQGRTGRLVDDGVLLEREDAIELLADLVLGVRRLEDLNNTKVVDDLEKWDARPTSQPELSLKQIETTT